MKAFILGQKLKNEQVFTASGERIPVTIITTAPCYLIDIKTKEKDGYFSAVVGFGKMKNQKKPVLGKLKKSGIEDKLAYIREFRLCEECAAVLEKEGKKGIMINEKEMFVGDKIAPTIFFNTDMLVSVTGTSKGKGFAGVVKRHNFGGLPASHGHPHQRVPGSVGSTTTPGRVFKGLRMAGRMGSDTITVKNLKVVETKEDQLIVKGLVPGPRKGYLSIVSY